MYSIKKLNDDTYKFTLMKRSILNKNDEIELPENYELTNPPVKTDGKLENNIIRARSAIFEYAFINEFDYFVTLTLDSKKYNREDLKTFIKDFGQMIRDYRKKYKKDIQYILIPELHKDGVSWHMHGLLKGLKQNELIKNKNGYLDWEQYSLKFGYISLSPVKNNEAVSKYITKYISKSFLSQKSVSEKYQKLYYVTRGLKKAEVIKKGSLSAKENLPFEFDYENEFCKIKTINKLDYDILNYMLTE